jgi:hypothetical protein
MDERARQRHLMLMKVNLGSATNALCSNRTFRHLSWDSEPRAKHGKASRDKDAFKKTFQRGLKLRRRRTMCAASKSEVVMSLRWAKRSSISLDLRAAGHGRLACSILYGLKHRAQSRCEKNLAKWPVSLLWLVANGPRPPFRDRCRRKVIFAVLRHAWRGSGMPSIDSRGSLRHD